MPTLSDVINLLYIRTAESIHKTKIAAQVITESEGPYKWVSPDGTKTSETKVEGYSYKKTVVQHVRGIQPKSSLWVEYRARRCQAHALMGAKLILKHCDGEVPSLADVLIVMSHNEKMLASQASTFSKQKKLIKGALKYLNRISKKLEDSGYAAHMQVEVDRCRAERKEALSARA